MNTRIEPATHEGAFLLRDVVRRHKAGEHIGITSVCSAPPLVLQAAIQHAAESGGTVLIEATSNQVDQTGGYTGLRPADFTLGATPEQRRDTIQRFREEVAAHVLS